MVILWVSVFNILGVFVWMFIIIGNFDFLYLIKLGIYLFKFLNEYVVEFNNLKLMFFVSLEVFVCFFV